VNPQRRRVLRPAVVLAGCAALGGVATLSGCALPRAATRPMVQRVHAGPCSTEAAAVLARGAPQGSAPAAAVMPDLVVWLPGAASRPEEFETHGFVAALRAAGVAADAVAVDSHLGYFRDASVLRALREDVIAPARARGVQRIWLVGISLGGFGALAYAQAHGEDLAGVLALAPFLGVPGQVQAVADAGGARAWAASEAARAAAAGSGREALEARLWRWLAEPPAGAPPVYLGWGTRDRFAAACELAAAALPPERSQRVPGGHDWPPWRALWQHWLARGLLPTRCPAVA
jgi:pimeloyl-ACP methyl ester carboxylesterase